MRTLVCGIFLTMAMAAAPAPVPGPVLVEKPKAALCYQIVDNLNEKSLHDELNLTEEQRQRLASFKGEWERHHEQAILHRLLPLSIDEYPNLDLAVNRSVDIALATVLEPAQFKRLQQIALRHLLLPEGAAERRNSTPILGKWPDLAEQLQLTEEQKKALKDKDAKTLDSFLTEEQKNKWADLIGPPFTLPFVGRFDLRRPRTQPRLEYLQSFRYVIADLRFTDVEKDLKLTREQANQLRSVDNEYYVALGEFTRKGGTEPDQTLDAVAKRLLAKIDKILTPEQAKRYQQLLNQFRFPTHSRPNEPHPVAQNPFEILPGLERGWGHDFELSRPQQQKLKELDGNRVAAVRKVLGQELAVSDLEKKINEIAETADADMLAVLTDKQRQTYSDLVGAPYHGFVPSIRLASIYRSPIYDRHMSNLRQLLNGLYYSELCSLSDEYVQAELALTTEQVNTIAERREQWRKALLPVAEALFLKDRRKALETLSAYIEKQMAEVLRPDQVQRLRQFAMQERRVLAKRGAIASYPGIAVELSLTAQQRDALCGGADASEILDEAQLKLLSRTCGPQFSFTIIERYLGRYVLDVSHEMGQPSLLRLLREPALRDEFPFKYEDKRLDELEVYRRHLLRSFQDANRGEPDEQCRAVIEKALTRRLQEAFSYEILRRLEEIERQQQSAPELLGLASVLLRSEETESLGLSERQQSKLRQLRDENEKLRQLVAKNALSTPSRRAIPSTKEEPDPAYQALMKILGECQQAKALAILTDKEKEGWQKLLGKPFQPKPKPVHWGQP